MTYALLIYRCTPTDDLPKDQGRGAMVHHRALQGDAAARHELHAVALLDEKARARTVRRQKDAHEVSDGPYIETKEWLVGFYLVDCDSEEHALERARSLCDDHHVIEVRPVKWRWRDEDRGKA